MPGPYAQSSLASSALTFPICTSHSHSTSPISGNLAQSAACYRTCFPSFPSVSHSSSSAFPSSPLPTTPLAFEETPTINTVPSTSPPPFQEPSPWPTGLPLRPRRTRCSSPKTLAQQKERQSTALRLALKRSQTSERLFARREDGRIILPPLLGCTQADAVSRTHNVHVPFFRLPDLNLSQNGNERRKNSKKIHLPPIDDQRRPPLSIGRPHSPELLSSFNQVYISDPSSSRQSKRTLIRRKGLQARHSVHRSAALISAAAPTVAAPVPQEFVRGWVTAHIRNNDDTPRPSTMLGSGDRDDPTVSTPPPSMTRPRSWAHSARSNLNSDRWGDPGDSNVDVELDVQDGRRLGTGPNDTFFLAWKSSDGIAFKEKVRGRGRG